MTTTICGHGAAWSKEYLDSVLPDHVKEAIAARARKMPEVPKS